MERTVTLPPVSDVIKTYRGPYPLSELQSARRVFIDLFSTNRSAVFRRVLHKCGILPDGTRKICLDDIFTIPDSMTDNPLNNLHKQILECAKIKETCSKSDNAKQKTCMSFLGKKPHTRDNVENRKSLEKINTIEKKVLEAKKVATSSTTTNSQDKINPQCSLLVSASSRRKHPLETDSNAVNSEREPKKRKTDCVTSVLLNEVKSDMATFFKCDICPFFTSELCALQKHFKKKKHQTASHVVGKTVDGDLLVNHILQAALIKNPSWF